MHQQPWWVLSCLVVTAWPAVPAPLAADTQLMPFRIEDQFDRVHTQADLAGQPLLINVSDRKGSQYADAWLTAIKKALGEEEWEQLAVVSVADVRGVPFFVKGSVKKKFPRSKDEWVLMDWKGRFAKHYGLERDACNLLLFNDTGLLVRREAVTELQPDLLAELVKLIALEQAPPPLRDDPLGLRSTLIR